MNAMETPQGPPQEVPAAPPAPPPAPSPTLRRELVALLVLCCIAIGIAFCLRFYVAQAYEIRGRSMLPTFHDGDKVLLLKLAPSVVSIARGDIVIFTHPGNPDKDVVKRVVGIGGDKVHIDRRGDVYVNGARTEPVVRTAPHGSARTWSVPENCYFVLGDNRDNSLDSRDFGCVPVDLVKGKVWFRWWPLAGREDAPAPADEE
jgi:signal peptidase I